MKRGAVGVAVTAEGVIFATIGVRHQIVGADAGATARFLVPLPGVVNTYSGANPARWTTGTPRYAAALVENVLPGVDVRYEVDAEGRLVQRLLLGAGVDPEGIVFEIRGTVVRTSIEPGDDLRVHLSLGTKPPGPQLVATPPPAVQPTPSGPLERQTRFRLLSNTRYVIAVDGRDAAFPLEIALTLSATNVDEGVSSSVHVRDENGATFGVAAVPDAAGKEAPFPASGWAACSQYLYAPGACTDVAVYKLSAEGDLAFVTYLEGRTRESAAFLDLAPNGDVAVAGSVDSTDFPTTSGALQPTSELLTYLH